MALQKVKLENCEIYKKEEAGFIVCVEITGLYILTGDFGNCFSLVYCPDDDCHYLTAKLTGGYKCEFL